MSSWIDKLLEIPFFYDYARAAITFGIRYRPIRKALDPAPTDAVIDLGCGTGTYSRIFKNKQNPFTGVEIYPQYYETARQRHNSDNIRFLHRDFFTLSDLPDKSYDLALMTGVLHHLTDEECLRILEITNRITKKRLVIQDLAPSRFHFISNFLMNSDRGKFQRSLENQKKIVQQVMNVKSIRCYYTNSRMVRHSLIIAEPR